MSTDAVRAALAELVRNFPTDTDLIEAGWLPHEIDAAMNAYDAARAALSEPAPGVGATRDDGEAHGTEYGISIDFMREPVADIAAKLRALTVARSLAAAPSPAMPVEPDKQLCTFYGVDTFPALVEAMEHHIKKLQAKLPQNDMPAATKTRFA